MAREGSPAGGAAGQRRTRRRLIVTLAVLAGVIAAAWLQVDPIEPPPAVAHRDDVSIIAHAGAQGHAPPNTMEAFDAAMELGADTLEMDLQVTADGRIATIHDGTVDRTTDGSGAVADLTLDELQALDAGATWEDADGDTPFAGQGVRHAALSEVFEAFPDTPLVIELKTDGGTDIIQPTIDLVEEYGRDDGSVIVASFDEDYLAPVREQLPDVPTNMPESEAEIFLYLHFAGLHPWWSPPGEVFQIPEDHGDRRVVTPRSVRAAERLGTDMQVWTVNDRDQMHRILDAGAHGIITDYPDRVVEVVEERAAERGTIHGADPRRYDGQLERAERLQDTAPWLTPVWAVVTFLGDEEFYLLMLPLLYWAVSRRLGVRLGVMLLVTAGVNGILKLAFTTPRPSFFRPELGGVTETSFGLPSGHAQNATAIWGLLAGLLRPWPVRIGLIALILAIGWSRIHLGVHFLEDMVVGVAVGLVLVGAFLALQGRVSRWWWRVGTLERILAALAASFALIAPALLLSTRLINVHFDWPAVVDLDAMTGAGGVVGPAGALAGFGIGGALLVARGGFDHRGPIGRRVARVVVGLVGVAAIYLGLSAAFPGGESPIELILRFIRYGLVGAWIGGLAPLVFVRLGLADPAPVPEFEPTESATPRVDGGGPE